MKEFGALTVLAMQSMFRHLTLRQITILLSAFLLFSGAIVVSAMTLIKQDTTSVSRLWDEFKVLSGDKARLETALRGAIGYNGMIHHFKNYVLSGTDHELEWARESVGAAYMLLDQYEALGTTTAEQTAIEDIRGTLEHYHAVFDIAFAMHRSTMPTREIDGAVKVDDSLAIRGLDTLREVLYRDQGFAAQDTSKTFILSEIVSRLGYGALIHNFKNYLLRQDNRYRDKARNDIVQLHQLIVSYRHLDVRRSEIVALQDLSKTLELYQAALDDVAA